MVRSIKFYQFLKINSYHTSIHYFKEQDLDRTIEGDRAAVLATSGALLVLAICDHASWTADNADAGSYTMYLGGHTGIVTIILSVHSGLYTILLPILLPLH